jgi:hypothetical protein
MRRIYPGLVLDLSSLDLEDIGNALADRTDDEHWWLIDPETGEIVMWTSDTGIDGQNPVGLDPFADSGDTSAPLRLPPAALPPPSPSRMGRGGA